MMMAFGLVIESAIISSTIYVYLNHKTHISLKFLYLDNILVIFSSAAISWAITYALDINSFLSFILNLIIVVGLIIGGGLMRFYRVPIRESDATEDDIVSPADGKIIYIREVESGQVPISLKNGRISNLAELTKTDLLNGNCWLIGINMTPFDVHKNCAPISGRVVLNRHYEGKFLSLKSTRSEIENERNTIVFKAGEVVVGMVQIASRRVRRILSYIKEGEDVVRGQWVGMITFGSQVDVIFPEEYSVCIGLNQQVYAGKSIIASRSR